MQCNFLSDLETRILLRRLRGSTGCTEEGRLSSSCRRRYELRLWALEAADRTDLRAERQ